jgi:hypothetical protein
MAKDSKETLIIKDVKAKVSKKEISRRYNVTYWQIKLLTDPEFKDKQTIVRRHREERRKANKTPRIRKNRKDSDDGRDTAEAEYDPLRDGIVYHTDPIAHMLGEPLPGRSALDQRLRYKPHQG